MLGHEDSVLRFLHTILALVSVLALSGCHRASTVVGAIACQGLGRPGESRSAEGWTFRGLDVRTPPRIRPGSYPSATFRVRFIGPDDVGPHCYWLDGKENNGILYTCRGGHIDLAHVRKAADWTGFLAALTLDRLRRGQTSFQFKLWEPSRYFVELTYPPGWDSMPSGERERVARETARQLGQYLAYTAMTWHEILTWFGFKPKGYTSEFQSAFSWEDSYSNLLGTCLAAAALEEQDRPFSDAMTVALQQRLDSLGAQPAAVARQAAEDVRGDWYSNWLLFTVIHKRNFDIGLEDGEVTPCLVPSVSPCEGSRICPLEAPTLDSLSDHGFSATVRIEPRVWERGRIFKALCGEPGCPIRRLDPEIDFAPLIRRMQEVYSY